MTRRFAQLKNRLMPYLLAVGTEASDRGIPVMRPMLLEFPDDPAARYLDRQYLLGSDLLVAPVFDESGEVEFYLPDGRWTDHWTGAVVDGGGWRRETHGFDTLPLYVREGAVIAWGARTDRSDYDYLDGLVLEVFPGSHGIRDVTVTTPEGVSATFTVERGADAVVITSAHDGAWSAKLAGGTTVVASTAGRATL